MLKFNCLGRLVKDVEISNAGELIIGKACIATNRRDKDKTTDFANVTIFGKTAENMAKYFSKGDMIYIEGRIQFNTYTDKDGNNRKSTELIVDTFEFCGSKSNNTNSTNEEGTFAVNDINEDGFSDGLPF